MGKKEDKKKWRENNKEKINEWNEKNKEKIKGYRKKWYENNKELKKEYRQKNKKNIKEYYEKNREKLLIKKKEYNINNREKNNKYSLNRKKTDINFKLRCVLRVRLYTALKQNTKTGSAVRDLGCSIEQLKSHLESQFIAGMSWNNHGNGKDKWNIDHITPLKSVDLTDREQLLKVCHYTNLRPLWYIENITRKY